jgi:hypothetical protein
MSEGVAAVIILETSEISVGGTVGNKEPGVGHLSTVVRTRTFARHFVMLYMKQSAQEVVGLVQKELTELLSLML